MKNEDFFSIGVSDVYNKYYPIEVTPSGWVFLVIWTIIFVWQVYIDFL
jgi:hypothetical protein